MPRNPGAKKNQHNRKHENGLVGPGKSVTKQKSNGQLNGSPKGAVPSEPAPAASSGVVPMTTQSNNISSSSLSESKQDTFQDPRKTGLIQRDSDSSFHENESAGQAANGSVEAPGRGQTSASLKARPSHDVNHFQIASSILRSSPACDTVAILIFLLALPSMVLTIVQALFASLTLMPPAGVSPGSLLSLFDVFQGSAGAPSLGTMVIVDAICFGLWFCLWNWAQNFALDLAQVQIAITLGSGSAGKSSTVNTACFAIVLLLHSTRSKGVRQFFYTRLMPAKVLTHGRFSQLTQLLPSEADFGESFEHANWIRSLFALHIISQALMAFVRRRVTSTLASSTTKTSKRVDAETGVGAVTQEPPALDPRTSIASASGVDYQPNSALKEIKEKGLTAKKKRRQANQVRSRQPFWAAVASTKVHVMREYEHKRSLSKTTSGQDGAMDTSSNEEMVWVTHVDPSSISFDATNVSLPDEDQETALSSNSKPFYVRINGAKWLSVNLGPAKHSDQMSQWRGEINGLAPNCTYNCSFIRSEDDEEFACVTVRTPALSDKEMPATQAPAPSRQSLRPSSPTSTLKNSISSAEGKLNDARNRLIKTRRSHKASLSKLEREVDTFNTRLKSSSDDNKQRQKLMQAEQSIRRTEDATVSISAALEDLAAIPEEDPEEYTSKKDIFDKQSELLAAANESLAAAKSSAKTELSCVKNEYTSVTGRKERLTSRQARLTEQHDRITQANAQGMNEKERKAAESAAKQAEQQKTEAEYMRQFTIINAEIQFLQGQTNAAYQNIQAHERQAQSQRDSMMKGPLAPDGNLAGSNPILNPPPSALYRGFNLGYNPSTLPPLYHSPEASQASPFLPFAKITTEDSRPRSDTNRSLGAISGYSVDFEDADPIPPMPTHIDFDVSGRKSSGSSRGKNSGSPGIIGMGLGQTSLGSPVQTGHSPGNGNAYGHGHVSTW